MFTPDEVRAMTEDEYRAVRKQFLESANQQSIPFLQTPYDPPIEHRGGLAWYEVPIPHRFHKCTAQTRGLTRDGRTIRRCACGAIAIGNDDWTERNSRKKAGNFTISPLP